MAFSAVAAYTEQQVANVFRGYFTCWKGRSNKADSLPAML